MRFHWRLNGRDMQPSVRTLLMREIIQLDNTGIGLVFYTNYDSAKAVIWRPTPMLKHYFWPSLERQIRLTGAVQRLAVNNPPRYFHSRPVIAN